MATFNQLTHLAIEEGKQQCTYMRAVNVCVGHDHDAVVAQLIRIVILAAYAAAKRGNQGSHFNRGEHLIETGLLHVQDLTLERQYGLSPALPTLLGAATG